MLEVLLPEYAKQLLENYQNIYSQLASQLRWLFFDDYFRLVTRVGYLDDGWIRVRVDTGSALDINLLEVLRELSWMFYNIAEVGKNVDVLKNALASIGTDELRVSVVDALPRSPFYLTDSAGNELSSYIMNYQSIYSQLASQLRWLYFDDTFRLVTRIGYIDDGWVRARIDTTSALDVNLIEILRELSWTFYNVAEANRLLELLAGALSSRATDSLRASIVTALPESPFNLTKVSGASLTPRDWSADFAKLQNLDVSLTTQATLKRFGRDVSPFWIFGSEATAPAAGTALVSRTVTSGKTGYIYGFVITAGEANDFGLNWTSGGTARSIRFALSSRGSVVLISPVAINDGLPADGGSAVSITNINAGSSGTVYQATLLYAEV
jgi:hypothetical protein